MKRYYLFIIAFVILFSGSAFAERLAVSVSTANIRSGPGQKYEIVWKAGKYYPILILKKYGEWFHFSNYERKKGWIHRSLVKKIPTVITKRIKCNIRKGPGTSYNISATVGKGVPFKIIKREGTWLNIQHAGGFVGWIHKNLVW